jgi:hypothetical protein
MLSLAPAHDNLIALYGLAYFDVLIANGILSWPGKKPELISAIIAVQNGGKRLERMLI